VIQLVCPECGQGLELGRTSQSEGSYTCGKFHNYPVLNGIPRFVKSEHYAQSFGVQWNTFDVVREEEDSEVFKVKTSLNPKELRGKIVLDAGCGGGRYAFLLGKAGAQVIGVDLSAAVQKAKSICQNLPNVQIIQGDLLNLPFSPGQFDLVYSIGVLHHTPDTRKAFQAVAKMVKPAGKLAVWVYRKNTMPQEWINSSLRAVTSRLPHSILKPVTFFMGAILGGIPVLNITLSRLVSLGSSVPDWRLRACDAFDWYSPKFQFHHSPEEVLDWFKEEGFTNVRLLRPQKTRRLYNWAYDHNLLNGSGVNVYGEKP